jgi:hypothetical protein
LPTFIGRPIEWRGLALAMHAKTRSVRPSTRPVDCGPRSALPPENTARSAPSIAVNWRRFETGGICAAASTMTGTPDACAMAITSGSGSASGSKYVPAKNRTHAVFGPIAARSSLAEPSISTIRTPVIRAE